MASPQPPAKNRLSDREIILNLLNTVSKRQVTLPDDINFELPNIDIYGGKDPWELFDHCPKDEEIYFLTKLKNRCSSRESWKEWIKASIMKNNGQEQIGVRRSFKYKLQKPPAADDPAEQYLLREYTLDKKFKVYAVDDRKDYAFCVLVKRDASGHPNASGFVKAPTERTADAYVDGLLDQILKANTTESVSPVNNAAAAEYVDGAGISHNKLKVLAEFGTDLDVYPEYRSQHGIPS